MKPNHLQERKRVLCNFCNGYYDFGSEQTVCSTCHAFVYEFCQLSMTDDLLSNEKEAFNDSGNEEPSAASDMYPSNTTTDWYDTSRSVNTATTRQIPGIIQGSVSSPFQNSSSLARRQLRGLHTPCSQLQSPTDCPSHHSPLAAHELCGSQTDSEPEHSLDDLPTEVLLRIFDMLDDISLWTLRHTSPRCRQVIDSGISESKWAKFVYLRWPLFLPHSRISSWRGLYFNLIQSVTCRICLERLRFPILFPVETPKLRYRRIVHEIKNLCTDPPYGIRVLALDTETYSHCLAGIEGPPQSPYQGGLFHVHILVPDSYPIRPPVIRFLTRILHPNISFHGDVGMDCIQHNWSLALTLEKLLISLQSLLTDPYTKVCMEPLIGALYTHDLARFEELAKLWTWKFACHDYLSVEFIASMVLPDYIEQMQQQQQQLVKN